MAYSPYKMKGHTLPGIKQVKSNKTKDGRAGSSAFQKKSDLDSIDNNRHAPARTKDTVDPADIKRREKKNTSKRVPTDKEARAEAIKNLYKPKSPAKKYASHAQRKAVHASKAEKSAVKKKGCGKKY